MCTEESGSFSNNLPFSGNWLVKKMTWCVSHPWLRLVAVASSALQREKVRNEALKGSTLLPLKVTGNTTADFSDNKRDKKAWNQNIHVPKPLKSKDWIPTIGTAQDKANGITNALWREHSFFLLLPGSCFLQFSFLGHQRASSAE